MYEKDPYLDSPEFSLAPAEIYLEILLAAQKQLSHFGDIDVRQDSIIKSTWLGSGVFKDLSEYADYEYVVVAYNYGTTDQEVLEAYMPKVEFRFVRRMESFVDERPLVWERLIAIYGTFRGDQQTAALHAEDNGHFQGDTGGAAVETLLTLRQTEQLLELARRVR